MPQRTNAFQRLIRLIEEQVAPAGAIVEESVMLLDNHDVTPREVDIFVRVPIGNREIRIGIECRDHKRRADLHWIEQMKSKFDLLSVDRRVALSRRGFSKAALARARLWNIETLSLEAAEKADWSARCNTFKKLELMQLSVVARGNITLSFAPELGLSDIIVKDAGKVPMRYTDGTQVSLTQYAQKVLDRLAESADSLPLVRSEAGNFRAVISVPKGAFIANYGEIRAEVAKLTVSFERTLRTSETELSHGMYNSTAFATTAGTMGDIAYTALATERRGEHPKLTLIVSGPAGDEKFALHHVDQIERD